VLELASSLLHALVGWFGISLIIAASWVTTIAVLRRDMAVALGGIAVLVCGAAVLAWALQSR
jgi:hypothetical protein